MATLALNPPVSRTSIAPSRTFANTSLLPKPGLLSPADSSSIGVRTTQALDANPANFRSDAGAAKSLVKNQGFAASSITGGLVNQTPVVRDDVRIPDAKVIKTTDDYTRFVKLLEKKYPEADALDINRAVRQHFYSDKGLRNQMPVFDSWLGKDGGKNLASLKGIEQDLQGMPSNVRNAQGDMINLPHLAVGIDTHYQLKKGKVSRLTAPWEALKGVGLTHGGDLGQAALGGVLAALTPFGDEHTFKGAVGYASMNQLRGNQAGLDIGSSYRPGQKLSAALTQEFKN